jgi:hypothetical protein
MPLWGLSDASDNAPKQVVIAGTVKTGANTYGNVTTGGFQAGVAVGTFAVDTTEQTVATRKPAHAGWVVQTVGTGPIATLAINNAGTGYDNTDLGVISGGGAPAAGNGAFSIVTDGDGVITGVTLTVAGSGYQGLTQPTFAVTNATGGASNGSSATFFATFGGRAGRVQMETLVAAGSITGDGSDDTQFPDT